MTAHLSDAQIRAYRDRSLAPGELLSLSEHICGCENCRTRIRPPEQLASAVRALRGQFRAAAAAVHVSYEEIASYADQTMAAHDRERVEAHVRDCPTCAADLTEIRTLRSELAGPAPSRESKTFWLKSLFGWSGGLVLAAVCVVLAMVIARVPSRPNATAVRVSPPPAGTTIQDGNRHLLLAAANQIRGLDGLSDRDRTFIEQALSGKPIERAPALQDLTGREGVLMGAPGPTAQGKLLAPLGTVVESGQPTFRWQPIAGSLYRISVFDTAYDVVASSPWISASDWRVSKPLRRGSRYSWQIAVRRNGSEFTVPTPPAPEARFRVLGETEEAEVARVRSQFSGSHLVLGMVYARAGLLDDAQQELRALRDQNPASQPVADLVTAVERQRDFTPEPRPSQ